MVDQLASRFPNSTSGRATGVYYRAVKAAHDLLIDYHATQHEIYQQRDSARTELSAVTKRYNESIAQAKVLAEENKQQKAFIETLQGNTVLARRALAGYRDNALKLANPVAPGVGLAVGGPVNPLWKPTVFDHFKDQVPQFYQGLSAAGVGAENAKRQARLVRPVEGPGTIVRKEHWDNIAQKWVRDPITLEVDASPVDQGANQSGGPDAFPAHNLVLGPRWR